MNLTKLNKESFWNKVYKTDTCWLWLAATDSCGYGTFWTGKEIRRAHRISYELYFGTIPKGLNILHKCDNPPCVRPDHLFAGTQADNVKDCELKKRGNHPKGEKQGLAKLTEKQVLEIRKLVSEGNSVRVVAKMYKVGKSNISYIARGESWKHLA